MPLFYSGHSIFLFARKYSDLSNFIWIISMIKYKSNSTRRHNVGKYGFIILFSYNIHCWFFLKFAYFIFEIYSHKAKIGRILPIASKEIVNAEMGSANGGFNQNKRQLEKTEFYLQLSFLCRSRSHFFINELIKRLHRWPNVMAETYFQ